MIKSFLLPFSILLVLALNVEAISHIEGTKQEHHHIIHHGSSSIGGNVRRIVRSPEPDPHYQSSHHSGGGGLEGIHHGGQFGVRGHGSRKVREMGKKVVGKRRLTREPFSRDLAHQGLIEGHQSLHGGNVRISRASNFVPKNAIESQQHLTGGQNSRISRDQSHQGFVGKQFTSGMGGIEEGQNIEHKGIRISRHHQMAANQPKQSNVRISRHNLA